MRPFDLQRRARRNAENSLAAIVCDRATAQAAQAAQDIWCERECGYEPYPQDEVVRVQVPQNLLQLPSTGKGMA